MSLAINLTCSLSDFEENEFGFFFRVVNWADDVSVDLLMFLQPCFSSLDVWHEEDKLLTSQSVWHCDILLEVRCGQERNQTLQLKLNQPTQIISDNMKNRWVLRPNRSSSAAEKRDSQNPVRCENCRNISGRFQIQSNQLDNLLRELEVVSLRAGHGLIMTGLTMQSVLTHGRHWVETEANPLNGL